MIVGDVVSYFDSYIKSPWKTLLVIWDLYSLAFGHRDVHDGECCCCAFHSFPNDKYRMDFIYFSGTNFLMNLL